MLDTALAPPAASLSLSPWLDPAWVAMPPAVAAVRRELQAFLDDEEIDRWFVEPNIWLADHCPADLLASDADAVVGVARADRFIARG